MTAPIPIRNHSRSGGYAAAEQVQGCLSRHLPYFAGLAHRATLIKQCPGSQEYTAPYRAPSIEGMSGDVEVPSIHGDPFPMIVARAIE